MAFIGSYLSGGIRNEMLFLISIMLIMLFGIIKAWESIKNLFSTKKKYADFGIVYANDLLFNLDDVRSSECLKNKGLESNFFINGLPYGWLCLRTRFRLCHRWNLALWFLNIVIPNSTPTQLSQKSFMHCWLPKKLNIPKSSLLYQPIWSFQTRCRKCFRPPMTLLVKLISGPFSINYQITLCLKMPNYSELG